MNIYLLNISISLYKKTRDVTVAGVVTGSTTGKNVHSPQTSNLEPNSISFLQLEYNRTSMVDPFLVIVVEEHVHLINTIFLQKYVKAVVLGFWWGCTGKGKVISSGNRCDKDPVKRIVSISYVRSYTREG